MCATIRGCLRLTMNEIELMTEDEFLQAYYQCEYYLSITHQVKFN
jgi:hypothetical protein